MSFLSLPFVIPVAIAVVSGFVLVEVVAVAVVVAIAFGLVETVASVVVVDMINIIMSLLCHT